MARKPKKSPQGFSAEDLTKFLLGDESLELFRQAKNLEVPRGGMQGTMAQQFGLSGVPSNARRFMGQIALGGEGVLKSNVADILGAKDSFLALENQSPVNALWAVLGVAPFSGLGKAGRKTAATLKSILNTLKSGDRNPRLEVGSRTPAKMDTETRALLDSYIYSILGPQK